MAKRKKAPARKKRKPVKKGKRPCPKDQGRRPNLSVLEEGSLSDLLEAKKFSQQQIDFYWRYHSELAHQRKAIESEISQVLIQTSISDFSFKDWQRSVKYKYGLQPFCTLGSLTDPGGRFNIGDINPQNFPVFPHYTLPMTRIPPFRKPSGKWKCRVRFNPSGTCPDERRFHHYFFDERHLDKVFDVRIAKNLKKFVNLIKDFKVSKELIDMAKQLGQPPPETVRQPKMLHQVLHESNWREWPMKVDVPTASQIFGQLVYFCRD